MKMPILIEKYDSREATHGPETGDVQLRYSIIGTTDDAIVRGLLQAAAPPSYDNLPLRDYHYAHEGGGVWQCTVTYSRKNNPEDDSEFAFDTGGGTAHITHSLETVERYAPPGQTAPDFQQAIGVTNDSVQGVDIVVPTYTFRATHRFDDAQITTAYKKRLASLTGKVNDGPFEGFERGEVLFLGASGTRRGTEKWSITFSFTAIPNVDNLKVGQIENIAKRGHEYAWVFTEDREDPNTNTVVKTPIAVYIERVYEYADFSLLLP